MHKPYIYELDADFAYQHSVFLGIDFQSDWIAISNGILIINKGYAHDGCSPKFSIAGLFVIGTPDGHNHRGKPLTYYASLVHDALLQYRYALMLSKEQVTQVFNDILSEVNWPLRAIYVKAVDWFGPQDFIT